MNGRPRASEMVAAALSRAVTGGNQCLAGQHLTALLARFGIHYQPGCRCKDMALKMNRMGCDWCESAAGMNEIVAAMRAEAAKRKLPFVDAAGRMLVRRAIANARRLSS
jgi:hypothetical protein